MKVDIKDKYSMRLHLVATLVHMLALCVAMYVWVRGLGTLRDISDACREIGAPYLYTTMCCLYMLIGAVVGVGLFVVTVCKSMSYKFHKDWKSVASLLWAGEAPNKYVLGTKDKSIKFNADSILTDRVDNMTIVISNGRVSILVPAPPALQ